MPKKIMLMFSAILFCVSIAWAQQYSINVESKYGFRYQGDYNGTFMTKGNYTIGPYNSPFTVNLVPLNNSVTLSSGSSGTWCYYTVDMLNSWIVNGTTQSGSSLTVSTTTSVPAVTVAEKWTILQGDNFECYLIGYDKSQYNSSVNSQFSTQIKANLSAYAGSPSKTLGSITLTVTYDPAILSLDYSAGSDAVTALPANLTTATNTPNPGKLVISSFSTSGILFSGEMGLYRINWKAQKTGASPLTIAVDNATDPAANKIIIPRQISSTVNVVSCACGYDVNGDGIVNIIDALMIAQYSVGLNPAGFNASLADINSDGVITIVDALIVAQKSVGLIS